MGDATLKSSYARAGRVLFLALLSALFPIPTFSARMAQALENPPPLEAMVGQMVMTGFRGTGGHPLSEDLRFLLEDIAKGKVGGVILFEPDYITKSGRNIQSRRQLRNLTAMMQKKAPIPLFIAVDQEGGRVRRLLPAHGAPATPAAREMGRATPAETYLRGKELGDFLARVGINTNFAPVVDLDVNPDSPAIGRMGRAFSAEAGPVARHAGAFAEGLASAKVLYCYKHFPGHGSAAEDSHAEYADITRTWKKEELDPYRRLLRKDMPGMVMVGHLLHMGLDPSRPSSLSSSTVNGLLRAELGWEGVVITDDLQMDAVSGAYSLKEAIRLALEAGADVILTGNNLRHDPRQGRRTYDIILELVRSGKIERRRIEESYGRITALKKNLF
ncbi:MAG: glycoside hydrolase family 3 [Desulfovibrio sp.]|nr:glycoside hydrolase family 3 [Desulfovibrio sp.]